MVAPGLIHNALHIQKMIQSTGGGLIQRSKPIRFISMVSIFGWTVAEMAGAMRFIRVRANGTWSSRNSSIPARLGPLRGCQSALAIGCFTATTHFTFAAIFHYQYCFLDDFQIPRLQRTIEPLNQLTRWVGWFSAWSCGPRIPVRLPTRTFPEGI